MLKSKGLLSIVAALSVLLTGCVPAPKPGYFYVSGNKAPAVALGSLQSHVMCMRITSVQSKTASRLKNTILCQRFYMDKTYETHDGRWDSVPAKGRYTYSLDPVHRNQSVLSYGLSSSVMVYLTYQSTYRGTFKAVDSGTPLYSGTFSLNRG